MTAQVKLRLDVNFGDPVTPAPQLVDLPALRPDFEPIRVLGYPIETVLAEKLATAIELGPANTRVRDFTDIYTLIGNTHSATARSAMRCTRRPPTAVRGCSPLSAVAGRLATLRAGSYAAYRSGLALPARIEELLQAVTMFADHWLTTGPTARGGIRRPGAGSRESPDSAPASETTSSASRWPGLDTVLAVGLRRTFRRRRLPGAWLLAVLTGLVFAVVTATTFSLQRWAAVGEWLGAVGTIAAVAVALHIANREARTAERRQRLELERREARELAETHQRELETASLILVDTEYVDKVLFDPRLHPNDAPDVVVRITNHSSEPILLPRLELLRHPADSGVSRWQVWDDPGGSNEGWGPKSSLAPGETDSFYANVSYEPEVPERWKYSVRPVIGFTDKAGRRWRRRGNELPYRVYSGDAEPIDGDDWYQVPQQ